METFRSDLRQIVSSYARPISILLNFQFPARHYRRSVEGVDGVDDREKSYVRRKPEFHPNPEARFCSRQSSGFRSSAISARLSRPSHPSRPRLIVPVAANIQPRQFSDTLARCRVHDRERTHCAGSFHDLYEFRRDYSYLKKLPPRNRSRVKPKNWKRSPTASTI